MGLCSGWWLGNGQRVSRGEKVIEVFRQMGVEVVRAMHCSGDLTRRLVAEAFGDRSLAGGVGMD
ncbi:MAG: hypothetical protein ACE5K7_03390, partial [Phycisphaerae bacterium]